MRIVNVTYSSEIRFWTTGAMTAGAEVANEKYKHYHYQYY